MNQRPINRGLLKANAIAVLKRNIWIPAAVCFLAALLGGNWNGLSGSSNSFNVRIPTTRYNYSTADFASSSTGTEAILNEFANAIRSTNRGSDFYYNYDSSLSEEENMKAFLNDVFSYYDISTEELLSSIFMTIGIILLISVIIWLIISIITFAIGSFVGAPISVGYRRFFMRNRENLGQITDLFYSFNGKHYMNVVKGMFATNIRMWGWSLLLYFPGLVKYYEYFMVSYILAENPTLDGKRAREISRKMTAGHKWQIFILELSFLGWALLFALALIFVAVISCGILAIPGALGAYFLRSYICATCAELYAERREYMLYNGLVSPDELPGFGAVPNNDPVDMSGFYATSNTAENMNSQTYGDSNINNNF